MYIEEKLNNILTKLNQIYGDSLTHQGIVSLKPIQKQYFATIPKNNIAKFFTAIQNINSEGNNNQCLIVTALVSIDSENFGAQVDLRADNTDFWFINNNRHHFININVHGVF